MHSSIETNGNLIKLKELSDKLCLDSFEEVVDDNNNKVIVSEINKIMEFEASEIENQKDKDEKLKCYKEMFQNLKIMVNKFKFC
jgi:hypothetical protein